MGSILSFSQYNCISGQKWHTGPLKTLFYPFVLTLFQTKGCCCCVRDRKCVWHGKRFHLQPCHSNKCGSGKPSYERPPCAAPKTARSTGPGCSQSPGHPGYHFHRQWLGLVLVVLVLVGRHCPLTHSFAKWNHWPRQESNVYLAHILGELYWGSPPTSEHLRTPPSLSQIVNCVFVFLWHRLTGSQFRLFELTLTLI